MRMLRASLSLKTLLLMLCTSWAGMSAASSTAQAAKCPNVHVVLDRSGSIPTASGTKTRWDVAKDAVNAVLDKYDGKPDRYVDLPQHRLRR